MDDYLIRFIKNNKEKYKTNFKYRFLDNFLYFLLLDNEIIYIGHTKNIEFRLLQHYNNIDFNYFIFFRLKDKNKMIMKEKEYILKYKPKRNKHHRIKTQLNKNSRKWSYT